MLSIVSVFIVNNVQLKSLAAIAVLAYGMYMTCPISKLSAMLVHTWCKPFLVEEMNRLETMSIANTFITFYLGQFFYLDYGEGVEILLTMILFVSNVGFYGYTFYRLYKRAKQLDTWKRVARRTKSITNALHRVHSRTQTQDFSEDGL